MPDPLTECARKAAVEATSCIDYGDKCGGDTKDCHPMCPHKESCDEELLLVQGIIERHMREYLIEWRRSLSAAFAANKVYLEKTIRAILKESTP